MASDDLHGRSQLVESLRNMRTLTAEDLEDDAQSLRQMRLIHNELAALNTYLADALPDRLQLEPSGRAVLYPYCVCYPNVGARDQSWASWKATLADQALREVTDQGHEAAEKACTGLVTEAVHNLAMRNRTFYLVQTNDHPSFGQSWGVRSGAASTHDEEAREEHAGRGGKGHVCAVMLVGREMYIYDPDHSEDDVEAGTRLNNVQCLATARYLRAEARRRRSAHIGDQIYLGGGGNEGAECIVMALAWLKRWVDWLVGVPGEEEPDLEDFIELRA